mmetsp:Transcript_20885/g.32577  ORF Transcript_20885/g.32577 Transcript_20885/m.32577 type:complete len:220 (-) Transcript_20885:27-686(-)
MMIGLGITSDISLGKVDKSSFSQQTLMELVIEKITDNKEKICGDAENPKDLLFWCMPIWGLKLEHEEVTRISLYKGGFKGSLQLEWLPSSVQYCSFSFNDLSGTVNLVELPESLEELLLNANNFEGPVCLTRLPPKMSRLRLDENRFCGSVDLTNLPASMEKLLLRTNRFEGKSDFSLLPEGLKELDVSHTKLEGEICPKKGQRVYVLHSKVKLLTETK